MATAAARRASSGFPAPGSGIEGPGV
jgi:hypothetical protein